MAVLTTRVQRLFHLFFLSTTSEKSFIPSKASAAVQALMVCPVRPIVLSSWGISRSAKSSVQLGNTSTQSGGGCLKKYLQLSLLLPLPSHKLHTFPKIHKKKKKKLGNNFVREAECCRWELKARNSAVQLCAYYDSSWFAAAGLVVDLAT